MGMLTAAIRPGLEQLIKEKGAKSEAALLDAAVEAFAVAADRSAGAIKVVLEP
jgi:hypothetical protein